MRARLCITAGYSTSSAMSSSSRSATARGPRPRGRGFCEGLRSPDQVGRRGVPMSGGACWRMVSADNCGNHGDYGGKSGAPRTVMGPPPDPGFRFRSPYPSPCPLPPPSHGRWVTQGSCWPSPPAFGPQRPPVYRPPHPRYSSQAQPRELRPPPPKQRPLADYRRSWVSSSLPPRPPPPKCARFRVVSYNILADYLAWDHRSKLYFHIPNALLDWEWRKRKLLFEFGLWSPDIMCLQEVDKFQDLEQELAQFGYNGIWKMRTGNAVDGCAIFWRTDRFVLRHEEHIEFAKVGLRDNVAQICVLESVNRSPAGNGSEALFSRCNPSLKTDRIVVCNIHVLYNPKRGDIKLGQVRVLLDRAYSVSKSWNDASIIICGDFNCTPKSPLYNFISEKKLNLSGLAKNAVSGQYSAYTYPPQSFTSSGLYRGHSSPNNGDRKISPADLDGHQSGVKDHITQNKVENALLVDSCSFHVSDEVCIYNQSESQKRSEVLATSGVEGDGHGILLPREKDLSNEAGKDITESSEDMTFMESERVEIFNSENASSQMNLYTTAELQTDDRYVNDFPFILDTIRKHEDQESKQNFGTPGNKGRWHNSHDPSHSLSVGKHVPSINMSELKHASSSHMSCTFSTMQEDTDHKKIEKTSIACYSVLPSEGNKEVFSPENGSENGLASKSEYANFPDNLESKSVSNEFPDDAISDTSISQGISQAFTFSVGTPLHEINEPSTGLKVVERNADLDVSVQDSYKSKPLKSSNLLDIHLDHEEFDLSVNAVQEVMKTASNESNQLVSDVHEKLPRITENVASENITYSNTSCRNSGNSAFSTGTEIEASPCLNVEEGVNSDSSFLEELHGTGNVPRLNQVISITSLASQPMPPLFPDPSTNVGSGLEEVESGSLSSNISNLTPEKVYDPLLWSPMEIAAASGNAECTLLEHNLSLTSAYTEVKDYAGTKDSSGEPQITSYNTQFMGTVDYIWHSEGLQTLRVLDTIPKHVLQQTCGFPTKKWGSDHLAIACEFSFKKA